MKVKTAANYWLHMGLLEKGSSADSNDDKVLMCVVKKKLASEHESTLYSCQMM